MTTEPLRAEIELTGPPDAAFELFTTGFERWWPREFSWSGADHLESIGIQPHLGGALFELGPHGLRWDWGRVLAWEPGHRLVFSWQIGPDRVPVPLAEDATEVEATFTETGTGRTSVVVVHRGWERHGEAGAEYREAFAQVWPYALGRML
jgi:uncharacterized protein YndB with AHSA1/START domain